MLNNRQIRPEGIMLLDKRKVLLEGVKGQVLSVELDAATRCPTKCL